MNQNLKKIGLLFGILTAIVYILAYLFFHFYNYKLILSTWAGLTLFLFTIIMGGMATYEARKQLKKISLKEAFIPYLITVSTAVFTSSSFLFILYGMIDTKTAQYINQEVVEQTKQISSNIQKIQEEKQQLTPQKQNTPENTPLDTPKNNQNFESPTQSANKVVQQAQNTNIFSAQTLFTSSAFRILILSIFGLLIAMILKNKSEF